MERLIVEIPADLHGEKEIHDWIAENAALFHEAMDLDATVYSDLAHVDKVRLTSVKIDRDDILIGYEFDYSAFLGCDETNIQGTAGECFIDGKREGPHLVFEKFTPREVRTSFEEF